MTECRSDKRYKWVMLGLLAFTYFLMHATRQVFRIASGARLSDRLAHRFPAIRINMLWIGLAISAPAMAAMVYMPNLWLCCLMTFVFGIVAK